MKKESKKFIADIAPLVRLPLAKSQSFSYISEKELSTGTLVSIPLFHQKIRGVVLSSRKDFPRLGKIELKKVSGVIEESFLTEKQLKLAKFISEHYLSPLGIVLKSFVPQIVKARKKTSFAQEKTKKIILNKEQKEAIKKISEKPNKFLLFGPSGSGKTEVYIHSILTLQKKDSENQALIILPELTLTPQAVERYSEHFDPETIVVLNSKISKGQLFENWKKIKSGQAKIILATRAGVFAPFKKLGLIVIDEEQDISHKQWDMTPKYDARTVSEELSRIYGCSLVFGSATPRIETFQKTKEKELNLLKIPYLEKNKVRSIEIVDMKKEYWEKNKFKKSKNQVIFSQALLAEIKNSLSKKEQIILFINRQGLANFSFCSECKTVLKCPKCDRALVAQKDGAFHCLHCQYKTSIFPKCSKCQNMHFENIGLGTQKIENEIQALFPLVKTLRLDNQTTQKAGSQEKIYQDFKNNKAQILIGTQMITKGWDLPNLGLVGIIDTDSLFNTPDYFTDEKAFNLILQVAGRTGRPKSKSGGKVILQTYSPENKIFSLIQEKDFESFFQKEIKERKALKIPPFGKIIKLNFQNPSSEKTKKEAEVLFETLSSENYPKTQVSPPSPAFVPKVRKNYIYQIIIKTENNIPKKLINKLEKLGSGWKIDVDPISIT